VYTACGEGGAVGAGESSIVGEEAAGPRGGDLATDRLHEAAVALRSLAVVADDVDKNGRGLAGEENEVFGWMNGVRERAKRAFERGNEVQNRTKNVSDRGCEVFFETKNSSFPGPGTRFESYAHLGRGIEAFFESPGTLDRGFAAFFGKKNCPLPGVGT
jgi:hypothetical protein